MSPRWLCNIQKEDLRLNMQMKNYKLQLKDKINDLYVCILAVCTWLPNSNDTESHLFIYSSTTQFLSAIHHIVFLIIYLSLTEHFHFFYLFAKMACLTHLNNVWMSWILPTQVWMNSNHHVVTLVTYYFTHIVKCSGTVACFRCSK